MYPSRVRLPLRVRCLERVLIFFFFQAEDGIRDLTVTGVQTCALPIWSDAHRPTALRVAHHIASFILRRPGAIDTGHVLSLGQHCHGSLFTADLTTLLRSEERRVGKECRSRWSPYH